MFPNRQNISLFQVHISVQMNSRNACCRKVTLPLGVEKCVSWYLVRPPRPAEMIWLVHTVFPRKFELVKDISTLGHSTQKLVFPASLEKSRRRGSLGHVRAQGRKGPLRGDGCHGALPMGVGWTPPRLPAGPAVT